MRCKEYGQSELLQWAEKLECSTRESFNKQIRKKLLWRGLIVSETFIIVAALIIWILGA